MAPLPTPSLAARALSGAPALARRPAFHRPRLPPSRSVATSRRTAKALRTKPFETALAASKAAQPREHRIVFNPPPAAPSPHHTPALFLPPDDPRRRLPLHASAFGPTTALAGAAAAGAPPGDLPPALRELPQKKYHLTPEQVDEIRSLRASNPWVWTRKRLAERFGCTEFFVGMVAQALPERVEWAQANADAVKARWGPTRRKARDEREKRKKLWERDE